MKEKLNNNLAESFNRTIVELKLARAIARATIAAHL